MLLFFQDGRAAVVNWATDRDICALELDSAWKGSLENDFMMSDYHLRFED